MNPNCKYVLSALLFVIIVLIISVSYWKIAVQAEEPPCCDPARFDVTAPKFPAGAHVTVTMSTALTSEERADIISGFEDWNRENVTNQSAIVYGPYILGETPIQTANQQFVGYQETITWRMCYRARPLVRK